MDYFQDIPPTLITNVAVVALLNQAETKRAPFGNSLDTHIMLRLL